MAGVLAPLYVFPDKSPKTVWAEIVSRRLVNELRHCLPRVRWRLQREEGVIRAGYQQIVKVEANDPAMRAQGLTRQAIQDAWDAVFSDVGVRWRL